MYDKEEINENTLKPEIIMHNNKTKGGVDVVDRLREWQDVGPW